MPATCRSTLPSVLSDARRPFGRWHGQHWSRTRWPRALWHEAVALAREHGLSQTARALGLAYGSLKKHLVESSSKPPGRTNANLDFVEWLARLMPSGSVECTLEWADASGSRVRLHIRGLVVADLVSLARGFREDRA